MLPRLEPAARMRVRVSGRTWDSWGCGSESDRPSGYDGAMWTPALVLLVAVVANDPPNFRVTGQAVLIRQVCGGGAKITEERCPQVFNQPCYRGPMPP